jgi:hypothetical protein
MSYVKPGSVQSFVSVAGVTVAAAGHIVPAGFGMMVGNVGT